MMKEFRLIHISADTPHQRGVQYGQQAREEIQVCIDTYRDRFQSTRGMSWDTVRGYAAAMLPCTEEAMPDIVAEARGIAQGAGVDFGDLMVLNCRYEILHFPHQNECTAFALQREATADGHVYVGQNWDNRPSLLAHTLLVHITEEETGNVIFGMTEAGQLIRNGFNSKGAGQCANSIRSTLDRQGEGVPSNFLRRKLLTMDNMAGMIRCIRTTRRTVSNNLCLGTRENLVADVEAVPGMPVRFEPTDGIVTHANHLLVNRDLDASSGMRQRGERLYALLHEKVGSITLEHIMTCLKDHEGAPQGICSHVSESGKVWQTNASLIYDLDAGRAWVCYGPPCEGEYKEYRL